MHQPAASTMFRSLASPAANRIAITINGNPFRAYGRSTVAEALLEAGVGAFRIHPVNHDLRGPYCLMGACLECMVMIDGEPGRQACMVVVREGMHIDTDPPGV